MDRLPYLRGAARESVKQLGAFGGLNKNLIISENEFSDMKNMSSNQFPAISVRRNRGSVIKTLSEPNGLFYKNGLVYADGTVLYYKGNKIADVENSKKIIVGMGAYLVVFPDKIMYNTASGTLEQMEASWQQAATATFSQTTEGSTMVKIACTGIGAQFAQYDGVEISGCTNGDFNKSAVIQEKANDYIIIIGSVEEQFTQASGLKITRTVPDMDYVCESENRLWGCSSANHEIYACKLGDPKNWQAFEGISTDSYAVTVGSDGDFTGCVSHLQMVLFFKENTIHKVFGNRPSNYEVNTSTPMRGVAKGMEQTMCIVNETLYYLSRDTVCSYDGAQPDSVGDAIRDLGFSTGVAGQCDGKYVVSLQDRSGRWGLYVYDCDRNLWHKEDDLHLLYAAYGDGDLYCIDDQGNLFSLYGDRKEYVPWMIESGDLLEGTVDYKHVRKLQFHMKLGKDAEVNVLMQYDGQEDWQPVMTYHAKEYRTHTMNIIPRRCQKYRCRLEGYGDMTLIAMGKVVGLGSDLHGGI